MFLNVYSSQIGDKGIMINREPVMFFSFVISLIAIEVGDLSLYLMAT